MLTNTYYIIFKLLELLSNNKRSSKGIRADLLIFRTDSLELAKSEN